MLQTFLRACFTMALVLSAAAQAPPEADITNGPVKAKLYLPDADRGYYRGTRFDWAGQIPSLEWNGHTYFGKWFDRYDPKLHDAIMGPVEEFLTGDSSLGYAEAKPGESFVRIGVGAVRKPEEASYGRFRTYEIVDAGKRVVNRGPDSVEFIHTLSDTNGYAYTYRKTVRLTKGRPELVIEHSLKNSGRKTIETSVYDHDFYMLDGQPTSPDITVKFPFEPRAKGDWKGLAEVRGRELVYLSELQKGQTAQVEFEGFGASAKDYDFRVENHKTGAGVRQTGDRPITKIVFWSIRTTVCPEAYVSLSIQPGKEASWSIRYEFYEIPKKN